MRKRLEFVWIDDNPEREVESKNIATQFKIKMRFIDVKGKDITNQLSNLLKSERPDLILIDHKFEDVDSGIFKAGSTAAAYIRETWPTCPIVCVTGADQNIIDSQKRDLYEAIFEISNISRHYSTIISIAAGFKNLEQRRPNNEEELLNLIGVPSDDRERIKAIFPNELKKISDPGLCTNLSHWVRGTLMERPGFLYDKLSLATLIGVKEASFHKVEKYFKKAKFTGIFSDTSKERWWKSEAISILNMRIQEAGLPWERGRKLKGLTKRDFSKSYVEGVDYPEVVAYVDNTPNSTRAPMKLFQTVPHPEFENMLFFDEIRMMNPD